MSQTAPSFSAEAAEKVRSLAGEKYKYGFVADIESETAPRGLDESTVRFISQKKDEPDWLLEWRLPAYRTWVGMQEPSWAKLGYPPIDYQDSYYYSAPKANVGPKTLNEIHPELLSTYAKLGIPPG